MTDLLPGADCSSAVKTAAAASSDNEDLYYDEDDDDDDQPPRERWAPLGASNPDAAPEAASPEQLTDLRQEQEQLTNSLMSLTSHFAQVQFRLSQVLDAPAEEREAMLHQLEEFSSRGVPDLRSLPQKDPSQQLIGQLRAQLDELEKFAYDTGQFDSPPTLQQLEQHRVVMDTLRSQLHVDVPLGKQLSADEMKRAVDSAVTQIAQPGKVKEQLVEQLKTQITDLERFIDFLQGENAVFPCTRAQNPNSVCLCPEHRPGKLKKANLGQPKDPNSDAEGGGGGGGGGGQSSADQRQSRARLHAVTVQMMRRAVALLQMVAVSQMGCGGQLLQSQGDASSGGGGGQSNLMKSGSGAAARHFGDLRARLEVAVTKVAEAAEESRSAEHDDLYITSEEVLLAVRKDLCPALRDLLLHGLALPGGLGVGGQLGAGPGGGQSGLVSLLGCFSVRRRTLAPKAAAAAGADPAAAAVASEQVWELFAEWYRMKGGQQYTDSPARRLSESFSLSTVGSKAVTVKEELLSAVHHVTGMHEEWGRGGDPRFKALVSLALNQGKLVPWLRLIARNTFFLDNWWTAWSYTAKTGWDDAFHSLNRLAKIPFQLPCDLAVRQFTNMTDAF